MRKARDLLRELTTKYPPGDGQRHGMCVNAEGALEIYLFLGEYNQGVVISDDDLDVSVYQSLATIDAILPDWCKNADLDERKPPDEGV